MKKLRFQFVHGVSLATLALITTNLAFGQVLDPTQIHGMLWRNVGPFRGGRVSAVTGVIGQPGVFYMGLPQGGVWKTTSAGTTWFPIFDSVKEASCVGSVEVAPSDPRVIYVGMGDLVTGLGINEGNGVYKSVDEGKTWIHLGLDETKQIPSILVDPHNPNLVILAAQGNLHVASETRGIYRSTDGGSTWTKTLYLDKETGGQKLAWAIDRPDVILATTDKHFYPVSAERPKPGTPPAVSTSAGTKLFKSTDEGVTWSEIKGGGLPNMLGRTCVAVATGTSAQRMFIIGSFGLYRSDDGGAKWRRMDPKDGRIMSGQGGYNCGVYVNPQNPNVVYVINTSSYISTDGGETFTGFKGAPGGDDPQQMWLDPTDGKRLFLGTDQGATVSLDGGQNWSSWYNQPTAQVYHISTDNQYPYWIYATQQDSGSIATASRGNLGAISMLDWLPHPGYEFGSIVADPLNPKISYAGGPTGGIIKTTYPSGQWIDVSPGIDPAAGLRHVLNQPMAFSPRNPRELLVGFQYLVATTDGGETWRKLSPDLGFPKGGPPKPKVEPGKPPAKVGNVVPDSFDPDEMWDADGEPQAQTGPPAGGAIESFSVSTADRGVIWVGTNNGLVKLTKNGGKTWDDVSIPGLPTPARADIASIDASHFDAGTAYVAVDFHGLADYTPWFYRTTDFGKSWTKVIHGMRTNQPGGSFARVIRADTRKTGLVFAGTESSMYVSFDNGDHWQSLMLNLPTTSFRDMVIHGDDLVVGTYGRSFWILDDISPLRQLTPWTQDQQVHLFKPAVAVRVRRNVNGDTPFPPEMPHALNPSPGATIDYFLGHKSAGVIELVVRDGAGRVVAHQSSAPIPPATNELQPIPDFWMERPVPMPNEAGLCRVNWNLRYDGPPSFSRSYEMTANPGLTPAGPEGPLVEPGEYELTLTVDGKTYVQRLRVVNDPRSPATDRELYAQCVAQKQAYDGANEAWIGFGRADALRKAVADLKVGNKDKEIETALTAFAAKLDLLAGTPHGPGFGRSPGKPLPPNFAQLNRTFLQQLSGMDAGDMAPNEAWKSALATTLRELAESRMAWRDFVAKDLVAFNDLLAKKHVKLLGVEPG